MNLPKIIDKVIDIARTVILIVVTISSLIIIGLFINWLI